MIYDHTKTKNFIKITNFFFLSTLLTLFFIFVLTRTNSFILNYRVVMDFELINFLPNTFNFILFFDFYRILFFFTVITISLRVFTFRSSYIASDKYYKRFHFLLFSFVASIILLIFRPNIVRVLLGWDGLGIRSYLLVIYYSRTKSYNAGIITVISNRLGDALIIISIGIFIYLNNINIFILFYTFDLSYFWVIIFIIVAASTKSAQIPFSAWLPAAIAAPTPVSSLVHSSTLVTAGVYLIFRFENLLNLVSINLLLFCVGSLTIFIARIRAFFEIDIKKIVALSTLSQLGIIITAIGAGFTLLGYFHLLAHAFFKALLFIRAGRLIHRSERFQDLRVMGGNTEVIPFTKRIVIGASLRLCGLPFMSAFYSKEIIIENLLMFNYRIYCYILLILGIFITIFYRARFIIISIISYNRQRALFNKTDEDPITNTRIIILLAPAIIGGAIISQKLNFSPLFFLITPYLKYFALIFLLSGVIMFRLFFKFGIIFYKSLVWGFNRLWGLSFVRARLPLIRILNLGDFLHKIIDFSWVYYIFTNYILKFFRPQISNGIVFRNIKFIRLLYNIFFSLIVLIYILW